MSWLFGSWQFFITVSVISLSIATILQRVLLKDNKTDGVTYAIFFQILAGVVIGIFAFLHGFHMPNFSGYLPNLLIAILFYGFGNICIFKSLSLIQASEFTILFTTRSLWSILVSIIFLGEKFSSLEIGGTILILCGVFFVTLSKKKISLNRKGLLFGMLSGFLFGVAFANDAYLVRNFDVLSYEAIAFILPGIGMLFIYPKTIGKMKELLLPGVFWKLFVFATLWGLSAVTIFLGYQIGRNAAQLSVLAQTSTILTVLLAIVFLRETSDLWKKVLGTILAFIGVVLIG